MLICLSPNGRNSFTGGERVTRMLVGTANGISVVERTAGGWRKADLKLPGLHVSSLLAEPVGGGIFAGMHFGKGLYFSSDGGETWEKRTQGLSIEHVYLLNSVANGGKVTLYAGTEPVSLFRSDDYGMNWRELPALKRVPGTEKWDFPAPPHVAHLKSLQIDPRDPRTIFAGVEQGGLFKSVDGGESWRELDHYSTPQDAVYKDIHRCLFRPSNPDEMYMTSGCGLYYSKDQGETWEHFTGRDFRIGYPDQLLFSPRDDRTMFLAGSEHDPGEWLSSHRANAMVMRSRDAGRNWTPAGRGLPESAPGNIEAMTLAATPDGIGLYVATTDGGVYASEDEADSWSEVVSGLAAISKGVHHFLLMPPGPDGRPAFLGAAL